MPLTVPVSPGAHHAPRVPVWAPDPGVPMIARLLAYIFGVLMLFTVISSLRPRPPDIPSYPNEWKLFQNYGFSIPYPTNWVMQDRTQGGNTHVAFFLPPRTDMVRVEVFAYRVEPSSVRDDAAWQISEAAAARFEEWLRQDYYTGYLSKQGTNITGYHYFTAHPLSDDGPPIVGAWVARAQGNTVLFITAVSSAQAWHVTESIFAAMVQRIQFIPPTSSR